MGAKILYTLNSNAHYLWGRHFILCRCVKFINLFIASFSCIYFFLHSLAFYPQRIFFFYNSPAQPNSSNLFKSRTGRFQEGFWQICGHVLKLVIIDNPIRDMLFNVGLDLPLSNCLSVRLYVQRSDRLFFLFFLTRYVTLLTTKKL